MWKWYPLGLISQDWGFDSLTRYHIFGVSMKQTTYLVEDLFSDIPNDTDHVLFTFPQELVDSTGWAAGDTLDLKVKNGCLHISRVETK